MPGESSSADFEDADIGRAEANYRGAVFEAPSEVRMPLFVALAVPLIGVYFVIDGLSGTGQTVLPGLLLIPVGFMLLGFGYGSLTVWIPRASAEGLVPPKRSILEAWRKRAPHAVPWANVREVTLSAPAAMAMPAGAGEPALRAKVVLQDGKPIELNRRFYADAFDRVLREARARQLVKGWMPELSSADRKAVEEEALLAQLPAGRVRLWDGAKARSRVRLTILGIGALMAMNAFVLVYFGSLVLWSPISLALLAPTGLTVYGLITLGQLIKRGRRIVDLELDHGRMRLPLDRRREMEGWRDLGELRLVAVDPAPEAVARAEALLAKVPAPPRVQKAWRRQLDVWACTGGFLVFTEDEMFFRRWRGKIGRTLEAHWRAKGARTAPAQAVARQV